VVISLGIFTENVTRVCPDETDTDYPLNNFIDRLLFNRPRSWSMESMENWPSRVDRKIID